MDPKIVISSKEMHWEFSHLVSLLLDVVRYTLWMADFRGPPSTVINIMINEYMYLAFIQSLGMI